MDWVRTSDGWESSAVLRMEPFEPAEPAVHPGLIATFQLGVSLFALLAFPSQVRRKQAVVAERVKRVRVPSRRRKAVFLGR